MNISYNWLKDLITIDPTAEEAAAALTRVGLAVEGIHPFGDDQVLDIDLTSNRPDCLSHFGVARELGVITKAETRPLVSRSVVRPSGTTSAEASPNLVKIEDPDLCYRFTARILRNVRIGPSPEWLVKRLEAVGERSINNVADITNYVMLELGQPMHAFDLDKLTDNRIIVRRARRGETIETLDEIDRKLDETMLAICDAEKPVAVAGVMGGLPTGITENTVNVLLEVAYFDRSSIRSTSRRLNLETEASYRFERGVDIENLAQASDRAAQLIVELARGEIGGFIDVYPTPVEPAVILSNYIDFAVHRLTGLRPDRETCDQILSALGITQETRGVYVAPTWRHDLALEEDLVEEVARHLGYDNIMDELPPAFGAGEYQKTELREKRLRQTLVDLGFDEAISYSFIDTRFDGMFETVPGVVDRQNENGYVTLQDSVIEGAVRMRPTILPGLLDAVRLNLNHQRRDLKLFELGKVFAASSGEYELPNEQELLSFALTGSELNEDRALPLRPLDFYDAKGAVEAAGDALRITNLSFVPAEVGHLRNGQSADILHEGRKIGSVGRLSDSISASYKFRQPVYIAELNLHALLDKDEAPGRYRPLAKYPAIIRDVTFIVKRNIEFASVTDAIHEQGFELCTSISFVDIYEGKGMAPDERSLTVRLEYRSNARTLIEDEVEQIHAQIVEGVQRRIGAGLRI